MLVETAVKPEILEGMQLLHTNMFVF